MSQQYWRHAAAGIQFGLFVLAGTFAGSYLDSKLGGSRLILAAGIIFGVTCGTYFLVKDFLQGDRGGGQKR